VYRDSFEGMSEQIRQLEHQRAELEADLLQLRRITGPRRVLYLALAVAVVTGGLALAHAAGGWGAVVEAREAAAEVSYREAWASRRRGDQQNNVIADMSRQLGRCEEDLLEQQQRVRRLEEAPDHDPLGTRRVPQ
jgi:hypothetical protein